MVQGIFVTLKSIVTSNMLAHIAKCPKMPLLIRVHPTQKLLNFEAKPDGKGGTLVGATLQTYSVKECWRALVIFIICDK